MNEAAVSQAGGGIRLDPRRMFPAGVAGVGARFVDLSTGVRLRVVEGGPADAAPLLLLHGIGASAYAWRHLLERPPVGFRCIAPDLRGHGLSDKPTARGAYRTSALLADLEALLTALDLEDVALAGHSLGGGIALHFRRTRPEHVSRLILVNPVGLAPKRLVAVHWLLPPWGVARLGSSLVPRWLVGMVLRHVVYAEAGLVTEEVVDEYWAPSQFDEYAVAFHALLREFDWRAHDRREFGAVQTRVLVILGEADRVIRGVRDAALAFPRGTVVEVPGAGHCVAEERPDRVRAEIETFLARTNFV